MARMENDERVAMAQERFRAWREGRRRGQRIPADLWRAAVGLVELYSVEQVAAALSVNEQRLAKRVGAAEGRIATQPETASIRRGGFVEIGVAGGGDTAEAVCSIEAQSPDGGKLIVRVPASAYAVVKQVVEALWVRGA